MRRPLTVAVLLLVALGAASGVRAQLPDTPRLPNLGGALFRHGAPAVQSAPRPSENAALFQPPATSLAGRDATLQALQDCYARQAPKVKTSGAAETRVRRLRQLCENEEIADTRAWLKWSKIGAGRSTQRIVNALQQDAAEKALAGEAPPLPEKL